jgi:hypothetical protein
MRKLILFLFMPSAFAACPSGYIYCKVVTTSHAMVSGSSDPANYPLTVILTDAALRTTGNSGLVNNANGYDIGLGSRAEARGTECAPQSHQSTASTIPSPNKANQTIGGKLSVKNHDMRINQYGGGCCLASGVEDEFRRSSGSTRRSADSILTEYRNQSSPRTYFSEGSQETYSAGTVWHIATGGE